MTSSYFLEQLQYFISKRDLKILLIASVAGGFTQIICQHYMMNHPELFEKIPNQVAPEPKKKRRLLPIPIPRGGAIMVTSLALTLVKILAEQGVSIGLGSAFAWIFAEKLTATAISTYLKDAFPQNLPNYSKKRFIMVEGKKVFLESKDFEFLFNALSDENIPYKEREKIGNHIFSYFDLKTNQGRVMFAIGISTILYALYKSGHSGFYILLQNLLKALREGRLSKRLARLILRRLRRLGVYLGPEFLDAVSE